MGDDDPMVARPRGIDMIVAHAPARDDFELWTARHQVCLDWTRGPAGRDRAQIWRKASEQRLAVLRLRHHMQIEVLPQPGDDRRLGDAEQ